MARGASRRVCEITGKFYSILIEHSTEILGARLALEGIASDGNSITDHVAKAAASGVESALDRLEAATIPSILVPIFVWYQELRSSTPDGFNRSPISFQEIESWIRCRNVFPHPWEIQCLRALDEAHWTYARKERDKNEKSNKRPKK